MKKIIDIEFDDNYLLFEAENKKFSLYTRLIEGKYPNVESLVPTNFNTIMHVKTEDFLRVIDRACLFAKEMRHNTVNLEIKKISSNFTEIRRIEESQEIRMLEGEVKFNIAFDGLYMMDALKVIKSKEVKISFGGSMKPIVIEPGDNSSLLHLISPVRFY
ncbi:hypothetical protein PB01_17090 [Psychrobacillus glaciei]|uniref:DNA polymerase III beta sliding clamp C-terminal domain-containing protein n=1 Tax=Psychrobacillus glaciei TaxID=2283160 RepID=A0A5J6SRX7_9BACI|nr:hypothetical protein [Psychrobacillus glaciei]QFG00380.1 hypothetical protein PB01_17090 [Psychrobacillus glaciei]